MIENMNRAELLQLQKDIEKRLTVLDKEHRKAALAAAEKAARDLGFSLDELTGKAKAAKSSVPAKYRDPETGKEWSGRGRRPAWLVDVDDLSRFEI